MSLDLKNYDPALMLGAVITDAGETTGPLVATTGTFSGAIVGSTTLAITGATTLTGLVTATGGVTSATTLYGATGLGLTYGGSTTAAILFSSSNLGFYFGSGAPTITAAQGSFYSNATGTSASTRAYINYGGTAGWNSITTAA